MTHTSPLDRVRSLLASPPPDPGGVLERIAGVPRDLVEAVLLSALDSGGVDRRNWQAVSFALREPGDDAALCLERIALDPARWASERAAAAWASLSSLPASAERGHEEALLLEAGMLAFLLAGDAEPLGAMLRGIDETSATVAILVGEPWRRASALGPEVWAPARRTAQMRAVIEGVPTATRDMLVWILGETVGSVIEREGPEPGTLTAARIGPRDGQRAFVVDFDLAAPHGHVTVVSVVIRASAGIRFGFVTPLCSPDEAERARRELVVPSPMVPAPVEGALALVLEALARDPEIPAEAADATRLLEPALQLVEAGSVSIAAQGSIH